MVSTSLNPNTGVKILYKHSKPCRKKSEVAKNLVKVEKIFLKSDNFYIVPYVFRLVNNDGGVKIRKNDNEGGEKRRKKYIGTRLLLTRSR